MGVDEVVGRKGDAETARVQADFAQRDRSPSPALAQEQQAELTPAQRLKAQLRAARKVNAGRQPAEILGGLVRLCRSMSTQLLWFVLIAVNDQRCAHSVSQVQELRKVAEEHPHLAKRAEELGVGFV